MLAVSIHAKSIGGLGVYGAAHSLPVEGGDIVFTPPSGPVAAVYITIANTAHHREAPITDAERAELTSLRADVAKVKAWLSGDAMSALEVLETLGLLPEDDPY